jgi:hypothetical protein
MYSVMTLGALVSSARTVSRLLAAATACLLVFGALALHALPAHAAPPPPAKPGDFNGDGFVDLAIGAPKQDYTGIKNAGGVSVVYGSASGLDSTAPVANQFWTENSAGMAGTSEHGDQFGLAVAVGDFNADGFSDLAAGMPGKSLGAKTRAGAVSVVYGSAAGLDATSPVANQVWTLDSPAIPGTARAGDMFGRSLAAGDFNGDGVADLAIGAPFKSGHAPGAGAALVIYGSGTGLLPGGSQLWNQDSAGVPGVERPGDQLAWSMTAGDFNGDGDDDLAVGNPFDDVDGVPDAGSVTVLYGSGSGLTSGGSQLLSQKTPGVPGAPENTDIFGWDVAAGAFDGSSRDGLAVGVPLEAMPGVGASGVVDVLPGSASGLTGTGAQAWSQNSTGVPGVAGDGDAFGASVATGDFGNGSATDLAVGVAADTIHGRPAAGSVNVLYGSGSGLTSTGAQLWDQATPGILDNAEPGDLFGADVATGDFDGDGHADLAVAATYEDLAPLTDAGAAAVIYADTGGAGLASAGNQFWTQDSPGMQNVARSNDQFAYSLA